MIKDINLSVDENLVSLAKVSLPNISFKFSLNEPTGNFFYDPWKLKSEFTGTVWEDILSTLAFLHGEARLINLAKETCYAAHADIDDRWHLNIVEGNSYLIDLDNKIMHSVLPNKWYSMDAGLVHSAVNFGGEDRIQLVVRQLLVNGTLKSPMPVTIKFNKSIFNWRYQFDHIYSPFLNRLNKAGKMQNFVIDDSSVSFVTEDTVKIPSHEWFEVVT
jgi:hypothetical protein